MNPLIADLRGLIEPDLEPPIEVFQGVELGAFEEVVPDQAEGFLFFSFSVRIAHSTGKGLEAVVTCEVEKVRVQIGLPSGP